MTQSAQDIFPDVIRVETAGACNFRCIHCPTGTEPNSREALTGEKFDLILGQFRARKFIPRVVVLYHGGEPLLNRNLVHFIRVLKDFGVKKTVITTNASLLSEQRAKEFITAGLDEMKVSFDGESPGENDAIRINGSFFQQAQNIKALCRLRKQLHRSNPAVIISNVRICSQDVLSPLIENNQEVFQEVPAYLREYFRDESREIEFRSFPAMVWPGYAAFGDLEACEFKPGKPRYCGSLFETFTIMANGDVVACCNDLKGELVLGNVFKTSMFEVWEGQEYIKLRANFRQQEYHPFCRKCYIVSPRYLCRVSLKA